MKKTFKRTLALLMTLIMLFTALPLTVFATQIEEPVVDNSSETQISSDSGMGKIVNNLTENEANSNFFVSDITISDKKATVEYSASADCKMVVAVYDEDTDKMLGSGIVDISKEEKKITTDIDIETLPDYYLVKAFFLGENNEALSEGFPCYKYTTAYEEFQNKTPEDYEGEKVILFDDVQEDFGVLNNDVVAPTASEKMTYTYDSATLTYTFKNATDEVENLKIGDIFHYEYGTKTNEFILLKVKSITVSGSTVTIVEDEDISLEEAFQFIRIDENADFSDVDDSDIELGSCLELADDTEVGDNSVVEPQVEYSGSFSTKLKIEYPKSEKDDKNAWSKGIKITGSFGYTLNSTLKLYYDINFGQDYYEFKMVLGHDLSFDISVTGFIEANKESLKISLPPVPIGPFEIVVSAYPVASFSGRIEALRLGVNVTNTVYVTHDSGGLQKNNDVETDCCDIGRVEIEIKLGLGVEVDGKLGKGIVASVSLAVEGGAVFTATPSVVGLWLDKHHDCLACLEGKVGAFLEGTVTLKLKFISDKFKLEWDAVKFTNNFYLFDFYLSINGDGINLGKGECPNVEHKIVVEVLTPAGKPFKGAIVEATTGRCDADGDKKFDETSMITDENGITEFYFKKGEHTVNVDADGYIKGSETFKIIASTKKVTVYLRESALSGSESTGDIIEFGLYPQSEVADSNLKSTLNNLSKTWISYGYYSGTGDDSDGQMKPGDYMKHADVTYQGIKYRGVNFTAYRPYGTGFQATMNGDHTFQDDNGYYTNTTYWFKYEPLKWRVLDPATGLALCENIIDAQAYNNTIYCSSGDIEFYQTTSCTTYANDYAKSSIKEWLNDDFYNTAFTSTQKSQIATTTLDNSGYKDESGYESKYNSATTYDKVFLLSYDDALNTAYGFSSSFSDTARIAKPTAYAKCQGTKSGGNSYWWLRTPGCGSEFSCTVEHDFLTYYWYVGANEGIRPALKLNLTSAISESYDLTTDSEEVVEESTVLTQSKTYACEAGENYTLLNVTSYGEDFELTTENLLYIDVRTADAEGKVDITFIPKSENPDSKTLLIGDFGGGTEVKLIGKTVIDKENGVIYGLPTGLSAENLESDYINASDKVTLEYDNDVIGTGTSVRVIDNETGEMLEEYTIVIYGDYNGDGIADAEDTTYFASISNFEEMEYYEKTYLFMAADINCDGAVDAMDEEDMYAVANFEAYIDHTITSGSKVVRY